MTEPTNKRGLGMKNKAISNNLISDEELELFIEKNCKLLTSKQLADMLHVTEGRY